MRKAMLSLLACLAIVLAALGSLWWFTKLPNRQANGFIRHWLPQPVALQQTQLNPAVTRISGASQQRLYFSGADPRWLLVTDTSLHNTDTLFFNTLPSASWRDPRILVDSPQVYMYAGQSAYFISGRLTTALVDTVRLYTPLFTRTAQVSPQLLAIRGFDSTQLNQVFKLINCTTGQVIKETPVITAINDAGFAGDGLLQYEKQTHRLVYVQLYQNRFFCLDTSLRILYTAHTIDTSYTNSVQLAIIQKDHNFQLMPSAPRLMVNLHCAVANGLVYVVSGLRADNEPYAHFIRHLPVDVYQLIDGQYAGSFYIPKLPGKKMMDLHIRQNLLVILYKEGNVASYALP